MSVTQGGKIGNNPRYGVIDLDHNQSSPRSKDLPSPLYTRRKLRISHLILVLVDERNEITKRRQIGYETRSDHGDKVKSGVWNAFGIG
jgi:hypothetical protein